MIVSPSTMATESALGQMREAMLPECRPITLRSHPLDLPDAPDQLDTPDPYLTRLTLTLTHHTHLTNLTHLTHI